MINELNAINKPFVILLNCVNPSSESAQALKAQLEEKYNIPVIGVNCLDLNEQDIKDILSAILYEFPVKEISVELPSWVVSLPKEHWLKSAVFACIEDSARELTHIGGVNSLSQSMTACEYIIEVRVCGIDFGCGGARLCITLNPELFYKVLGEETGLDIQSEAELMPCMIELANMKREYEKVKCSAGRSKCTGYGIVSPRW